MEKEGGGFMIGKEVPNNPILSAVSLYYVRLIDYVVQYMVNFISSAKNLPKFADPVPVIIAGGTSLANGYVDTFKTTLDKYKQDLPFEIKEVRAAKAPLRSVARGLLIASQLT